MLAISTFVDQRLSELNNLETKFITSEKVTAYMYNCYVVQQVQLGKPLQKSTVLVYITGKLPE